MFAPDFRIRRTCNVGGEQGGGGLHKLLRRHVDELLELAIAMGLVKIAQLGELFLARLGQTPQHRCHVQETAASKHQLWTMPKAVKAMALQLAG